MNITQMTITHTDQDSVSILKLTGELLGGEQAEPLSQKVSELLAANRKKILLDLSGVDYANSSGIGLLVRLNLRVHSAGGTFVLISPSPNVAKTLQQTNLTSVLDIRSTTEEAVRYFRRQQAL